MDLAGLEMIVALVLAIALAAYWGYGLFLARQAERREPARLFKDVLLIMNGARVSASDAKGVYKLEGQYNGRHFQLKAIVDNLATRKLPGLWLMVTRPESLPVRQTIDIMMRPTAPTSFSNFDLLQHNVPLPIGFPAQAVARTDLAAGPISWDPLLKLAHFLQDPRGKELLVSPKGVRLVVLIAEADRARYGVFRQADFGKPTIGADVVLPLLLALSTLEDDLKHGYETEHEFT